MLSSPAGLSTQTSQDGGPPYEKACAIKHDRAQAFASSGRAGESADVFGVSQHDACNCYQLGRNHTKMLVGLFGADTGPNLELLSSFAFASTLRLFHDCHHHVFALVLLH